MRVKILDAVSMAASFESAVMDMRRCKAGYAAQFVYTGTPTGSLKIQASIDGSNWEDITGSIQALAGAAGKSLYNTASDQHYPFIKIVYVRTGGVGSLTVHVSGRDSK